MKKFLSKLPGYVAYSRKAVIQLTTLVTSLLSLGLLPDPYKGYAVLALGILGTVAHFLTPNAPKPSDPTPATPVEGAVVQPKALPVGSYPATEEIPVIDGDTVIPELP